MTYRVRIKNPVMGVPITFLGKWNPNQFDVLGIDREIIYEITGKVSRFYISGVEKYARILIRRKRIRSGQ